MSTHNGVMHLGRAVESLETTRLSLRVPRAGDGVLINRTVLASLGQLGRWWKWAAQAPTLRESEAIAQQERRAFASRSKLPYLILEKATGEHVGSISLGHFDHARNAADFAYFCSTAHTGNGYITEAVNALTDHAFGALQIAALTIRADARNLKSRRVAERCRYTYVGLQRADETDVDGRAFEWAVYTRENPSSL